MRAPIVALLATASMQVLSFLSNSPAVWQRNSRLDLTETAWATCKAMDKQFCLFINTGIVWVETRCSLFQQLSLNSQELS